MIKETKKDSMFGNFVYDEIIPGDHPMRMLAELINWEYFGMRLMKKYKGGGKTGRAPYNPALMLKMLFVKHIYDLDDRGTENWCMENLPAKFFLGIAVNELPPDHTTLHKFRQRITERDLDMILKKILEKVQEKGIKLGKAVIVDSTDIEACMSDDVDDDTKRRGGRDNDARWMSKKKGDKKYSWFGYKEHTAVEDEHGLFLGLKVTQANVYDGHYLKPLIETSRRKIFVETGIADRGYDDGENFEYLFEEEINPAIHMKGTRMKHEKWRNLVQEEWYEPSLKKRFRVEQTNAIQKNHAGSKSRAIGLKRTRTYCWMSALAVTAKRALKLMYGVNFKTTINRATFSYSSA